MSSRVDGGHAQLSVCVPTYNRPDLLRRALESVVACESSASQSMELVVSDNSEGDASEEVFRTVTRDWCGQARYVRHRPGVGMVGNFNQCVELATGRYVLILHDDDYLNSESLPSLLSELVHAELDVAVLLGGVRVIDSEGSVLRRQTFSHRRYLPPERALRRLMRNSSFVRFPGIVVRRDAYGTVGSFAEDLGGTTDLDMWSRLFARYGVFCLPFTTANYVVHPAAHTSGVWTLETIERVLRIFVRVQHEGLLTERAWKRCRADWLHQFVLGGVLRRLRAGDRAGALQILRLLDEPAVRAAGTSKRWLPIQALFRTVTKTHLLDKDVLAGHTKDL